MNWLAQNGIWIVVVIGVVLLLTRRSLHSFGGRFGSIAGHEHDSHHDAPRSAVDPVSGKAVTTDRAITAFFRGRVYYFESDENRRRFEAGPEAFPLEQGVDAPAGDSHRGHRHHGC